MIIITKVQCFGLFYERCNRLADACCIMGAALKRRGLHRVRLAHSHPKNGTTVLGAIPKQIDRPDRRPSVHHIQWRGDYGSVQVFRLERRPAIKFRDNARDGARLAAGIRANPCNRYYPSDGFPHDCCRVRI